MRVLPCASAKSVWRGYNYFKDGNVVSVTPNNENGTYSAKVKGREAEPYNVCLNLRHPRNSACTCPLANGKRIICKHAIAVYFTLFPKEAEEYYKNVLLVEEDAEREEERCENRFNSYIKSRNKEQLINIVYTLMDFLSDYEREEFISSIDEFDNDLYGNVCIPQRFVIF